MAAVAARALLAPAQVDIPAVEQEIIDDLKDQTGAKVTVDCPASVDWNKGGEFHCLVEDKR